MTPVRLRVRELREARGMSQAELAAAAGIRKATVSDIENAKTTRVDLATLERIADALGVDASMLIVHDRKKAKK